MKNLLRMMMISVVAATLSACLPDSDLGNSSVRKAQTRSAQATGLARSLTIVGSQTISAFTDPANTNSPFIQALAAGGIDSLTTRNIDLNSLSISSLGPAAGIVAAGYCADTSADLEKSLIVWLTPNENNRFAPRALGEGSTGAVMSKLSEITDPTSVGIADGNTIKMRNGGVKTLGDCATVFNIPIGSPVMVFANLEAPDVMTEVTTRTETRTRACPSGQTGTITERKIYNVDGKGAETVNQDWAVVTNLCSTQLASVSIQSPSVGKTNIGSSVQDLLNNLSSGELKDALSALQDKDCKTNTVTKTETDLETGQAVRKTYSTCDTTESIAELIADTKSVPIGDPRYETLVTACSSSTIGQSIDNFSADNIPGAGGIIIPGKWDATRWQPNNGVLYVRQIQDYSVTSSDGTVKVLSLRGSWEGRSINCSRTETISFSVDEFAPEWASLGIDVNNLRLINDGSLGVPFYTETRNASGIGTLWDTIRSSITGIRSINTSGVISNHSTIPSSVSGYSDIWNQLGAGSSSNIIIMAGDNFYVLSNDAFSTADYAHLSSLLNNSFDNVIIAETSTTTSGSVDLNTYRREDFVSRWSGGSSNVSGIVFTRTATVNSWENPVQRIPTQPSYSPWQPESIGGQWEESINENISCPTGTDGVRTRVRVHTLIGYQQIRSSEWITGDNCGGVCLTDNSGRKSVNNTVITRWASLGSNNANAQFTGSDGTLRNNCPSGYTPTQLRDDGDTSHSVSEASRRDIDTQLCLKTSLNAVTISSEWALGSCSAGFIHTGVFDSDDNTSGQYLDKNSSHYKHLHDLNEEGSTVNELRWCLRANDTSGSSQLKITQTSGPTCPAGSTLLVNASGSEWNLNHEDGTINRSVCVSVESVVEDRTLCPITGPWTIGAWSACSVSCGGGTQTRSVSCSFDSCTGAQPAASQSCNTQACAPVCTASTETRTSTPCPAGETGSITEQRTVNQGDVCGVNSNWVETVNTCAPVCPESTETRNSTPCPSGQTGTITEQRTINQGDVCNSNSVWTVVTNSCSATCTERTETDNPSCPAGQSGSITRTRTLDVGNVCGVNSNWVETVNTCALNCTESTETRTSTPCLSGQTGTITEQRTIDQGNVCGSNSIWTVISNTCTPVCTENTETRTSTPCPSGLTGTITEERIVDQGNICGVNSNWVETANTCTATSCTERTETRNPSCPAGQTGSITEQRTIDQGNICGVNSNWIETANTCTATSCTASTETRTSTPCPAGETGLITEQRTINQGDVCGVNSNWVETANTCAPTTPEPVYNWYAGPWSSCSATPTTGPWTTGAWSLCSVSCGGGTQTRSVSCSFDSCIGAQPATSQSCNTQACAPVCPASTETRSTTACPSGQTGSITEQRTINQGDVCGANSNWTVTSNTCAPTTPEPVSAVCKEGLGPSSDHAPDMCINNINLFGTSVPLWTVMMSNGTNQIWYSLPANTTCNPLPNTIKHTQAEINNVPNCGAPSSCIPYTGNYISAEVYLDSIDNTGPACDEFNEERVMCEDNGIVFENCDVANLVYLEGNQSNQTEICHATANIRPKCTECLTNGSMTYLEFPNSAADSLFTCEPGEDLVIDGVGTFSDDAGNVGYRAPGTFRCQVRSGC